LLAKAPEDADSKDVPAYYAQFPERMVWAAVIENEGGGTGHGGKGNAWGRAQAARKPPTTRTNSSCAST